MSLDRDLFNDAGLLAEAEAIGLDRPSCEADEPSSNSEADQKPQAKPELADDALHGPIGDLVRLIEPHTEADSAAILIQALVAIGNLIGRTAYYRVEADKHYVNLFCVLVGHTSKGRKGTSFGHVRKVLSLIEEAAAGRIVNGLASGEGLIWAVRDPIVERTPIKQNGRVADYEEVQTDAGVDDKRLLVVEPEFAKVLAVCERETNTLSAVVREAWDTGDLQTLTKQKSARATGAHISIVGHITDDELRRMLSSTQAGNGFGNRFLWVNVARSKLLPEGGRFHEVDLDPIVARFREAVEFARNAGEIRKSARARALWAEIYDQLSEGKPGLVGSLTSRSEAQVTRLATLYAVLDKSRTIEAEHLTAALAVWQYCEKSAEAVFGDAIGDPVADQVLLALRQNGPMTRTQISGVLGRHQKKGRVDQVLQSLRSLGKVRVEKGESSQTGGRPVEAWEATGR